MEKVSQISKRKADHIRVNLDRDVKSGISHGLGEYFFTHEALPEINYSEIDTGIRIFGKDLSIPLLISSMTGGTEQAQQINTNLAIAAEDQRIAMGLGSQRAALEDPSLIKTFKVRKFAPNILLFANIGAIQLNNGVSLSDCEILIDMVEADGLILHLNPLQEAIQENGNTNYSGLINKIEQLCKKINIPVIVKEVGWGISKRTAEMLINCGVSAIDVAGAGGTSWSQVEKHVANNEEAKQLASIFRSWGISTARSILNIKDISNKATIIASGGLTNGLDMSKCIALGASMTGAAGLFLKRAVVSPDEVINQINQLSREIKTVMFATGSLQIDDLSGKLIEEN